MAKPFADLKKIKNRYCLYTSTHIYDHVLQLDILKKNFFAKYPEIEFKFGVRKQIKDFFNFDDTFINVEDLESVKNKFGKVEELTADLKTSPVEKYCIDNDISLVATKERIQGKGAEIVVFTKGNGVVKPLDDMDLTKIRRIFGPSLIIDPPDFLHNIKGKFIIGVNCWQIFYAASKNLPTFLITSIEGTSLFEKMFPLQKKLNL